MSNFSATEIRAWLANAAVGEAMTYFRGFLALAREDGGRMPGAADTPRLIEVANVLWMAAQHGRVHLVQVRHGVEDYTYLAVARGRDAGGRRTLATFPADSVGPSPTTAAEPATSLARRGTHPTSLLSL